MLDSKGVLYRGRDNLNQWKSAHAIETKKRTLDEAIDGADVFLGLSSKSILSKNMVKKMAKNPIIFACANPDPEITPEEVEEVRKDAIVATGRSDYVNQVNNLKSLYNTAYEDPESFEQVSAQISSAIQEITSSVTPEANDNHLDGLIQEIIKIVDNQSAEVEKQSKEKIKKKASKKAKKS